MFVAAPGVRSDGHDYARQAVAAGAVAVIGSRAGLTMLDGVPYYQVDNPREALGILAHALAGDPSRDMTVIGEAGDGAEAVTAYDRAKQSGAAFDAVIVDLTVPGGMGGKEAVKRLLELDPQARAIVSSGWPIA